MDKADQAEKPLRRVGRPRKVVEGADVVIEKVATVEAFLEPLDGPRTLEPSPFAQAFAKAVWDAQTPTEPRAWRLERVALAMANKGFSMEGIVL